MCWHRLHGSPCNACCCCYWHTHTHPRVCHASTTAPCAACECTPACRLPALRAQEWEHAKKKQDNQLDRIEKGVTTLGEIAKGMQEELDKQNPIINEIDSQVGPASTRDGVCQLCRSALSAWVTNWWCLLEQSQQQHVCAPAMATSAHVVC
jgi:hypothetical protein